MGYEPLARLLLDKSFDIDVSIPEYHGFTALHIAAEQGHGTVVRLLLGRGAAIDSCSTYGRSALYLATVAGHEKIVKQLLEEGADVSLVGYDG